MHYFMLSNQQKTPPKAVKPFLGVRVITVPENWLVSRKFINRNALSLAYWEVVVVPTTGTVHCYSVAYCTGVTRQ